MTQFKNQKQGKELNGERRASRTRQKTRETHETTKKGLQHLYHLLHIQIHSLASLVYQLQRSLQFLSRDLLEPKSVAH